MIGNTDRMKIMVHEEKSKDIVMANWRPADVRLVQFEISWLVSSDFI